MHATLTAATAAALILLAGGAGAQSAASPPPGASAPRYGGPGMGPGMGQGMMGPGRWGADFTPGWALMTPAERDAHRKEMLDAKTRSECEAAIEKHRQSMVDRAKQQGRAAPMAPRGNPCGDYPG